MKMLSWLRRSFIAGFFVTVPLVVSVVAIVWVFRLVDGLTSGLGRRFFEHPWPGLGIVATALIILAIGALTANVLGQRLLRKSEQILLHLPVFRTVYAPVRQLLSAFSPDNEVGFKRMVLVEDQAGVVEQPQRGLDEAALVRDGQAEAGGHRAVAPSLSSIAR